MSTKQVEAGPRAEPNVPESASRSRLWRIGPLVAVLAGLGIGYAMGWHDYLSLSYLGEKGGALRQAAADNPVAAPALFFIVYATAVAFSFPAASVLTVFSGFIFGWLLGGTIVAFAATLGATVIFLVAKSAFGDFLRRKSGARAERLAEGFERNAFGYLLALRLAPVFPFFLMNIIPALLRVPLRTYVVATFFGILPGTFAYAFLGQGVESVLATARAAGTEASIGDLVTPEITIAFVLLALVAIVPTIVRHLRGRQG